MKFTRAGEWFEISEDGCFTVAATRTGDLFKFQAWLLGKPSKLLGTFGDAASARKCCETYVSGQPA